MTTSAVFSRLRNIAGPAIVVAGGALLFAPVSLALREAEAMRDPIVRADLQLARELTASRLSLEMQQALDADDAELASSLAAAQESQRRERPELQAGIGGSTRPGSLKCLHAHAAYALARPGYELGDRILAELPALWPSSCCTPVDAA